MYNTYICTYFFSQAILRYVDKFVLCYSDLFHILKIYVALIMLNCWISDYLHVKLTCLICINVNNLQICSQ